MVDPGDLKSSCRCSAGSSPVARTNQLLVPNSLDERTKAYAVPSVGTAGPLVAVDG